MNNITSCQLICLQKTHDAIDLPHGETVVIGRSPQTKITDPRCSRTQLELTADWQHQIVSVKQKGLNPTAVDGKEIGSDSEVTMSPDSTLFILSGLFPHKVVFTASKDSLVENPSDRSLNINRPDEQKIDNKKKQQPQNVNSVNKVMSSDKKERTKTEEAQRKKDADNHATDSKTSTPASREQHKTVSASKRHIDNSDAKQPVEKKMKIENKSNINGNGESKTGSSSKHNGASVHKTPATKEVNHTGLSITKHKDNARVSNDATEHEDDTHLANVNEKLKKMKQNTAGDIKTNPKKTEKVSVPGSSSSSSPSSSSHNLKKLSESSNSGGKTLAVSSEVSANSSWDYSTDYYVFTSKGVVPSRKIAGFDLDGTIIGTRSGKAFPQDSDDWKIYIPEIFNKLKDLQTKKYKIAFFTNQLGVARGKTKIEDLMKKIENVVAKLQVPVQVFIATHEGRFRKPMTGMWELLENKLNGGVSIDLASSFFVGDAAGRQEKWAPKKKKDFSCSDRLFALNIGIAFKTPEEFFQDQKPTTLFKMPDFDPRKLSSDEKLLSGDSKLTSDSKEVILLVGFPASGKSHFATNVLGPNGYQVINRDSLGSWQKCVKSAQEALVNSSVVIDNTNLTKEERARYVMCAKKAGVPCRCFVFTTTVEHCRHNERFRQMTEKFRQMTTKPHGKINEMIFNQIKKKYEEPSMTEGFTEIVNVNFVPHFSSKEEEALYRKFLLEK